MKICEIPLLLPLGSYGSITFRFTSIRNSLCELNDPDNIICLTWNAEAWYYPSGTSNPAIDGGNRVNMDSLALKNYS